MLDAAVDRGLERVVVSDVYLGRDDAAVQRLDQVRGFGEVFGSRARLRRILDVPADVDRDDVGTLLRQLHRVAAALPARRTGDKGDLAFYPSSH